MKALLESLKPADSDWALAQSIDAARLPSHIAIIMDGNGRWAGRRGLPRVAGHKAGAEAARATVDTSARLGIKTLTLYAFSVENWKRPRREVETLWRLLHFYMGKELPALMENDIRVTAIGRLDALPDKVREDLKVIEQTTRRNRGLQVNVAINYSGRAEIVDAANALVDEARREGRLPDLHIDEEALRSRLYTAGSPDPELLIRTSGELRVSNFLLWQIAYSEIYVTDTLWPDFRRTHLLQAVLEYQKRDRRFGGLNTAAPRTINEEELIEALGSPAK
jgi:undecaprenyl diphosphate synthase